VTKLIVNKYIVMRFKKETRKGMATIASIYFGPQN